MEDLKECRNCAERKRITDTEVQEAIQKLTRSKNISLADSKLYRHRLELCSQCSYLEEDTCLHCGCYVKIRAKLLKAGCPYPKIPKW